MNRSFVALASKLHHVLPRLLLELRLRVGGFEEAFRSLYEDQVFYAKVCLKAPVFVSDQCWDRYRQHQESACAVAGKTGLNHSAHLTFLNWVEEYLSQQGVKNAEVWEALQKKLRPYRQPILRRLFVWGQHRIRQMQGLLRKIARRTLPAPVHEWLRAAPPVIRYWTLLACKRPANDST